MKQMEVNVNVGLESWRAEIDSIDAELLRLLNKRASLVVEIGRLKRRVGVPFYDPHRERNILARAHRINIGPMDKRAITKIFRRIMFESRRIASGQNIKP
jgi:chorismate mutase-like protein